MGCESLTSIEIPNSVTKIEDGAFSACHNIKSIKIPDSVVSIGTSAFAHCEQIKEIIIPASVQSIGSNAFFNCNLRKIYYCTNSPIGFENLGFYDSVYGTAQLYLSKGAGDVSDLTPWNKFLNIEEMDFISNPPVFSTYRDFEYEGLWYTVLDEETKTCETKQGIYNVGSGIPGNRDYWSEKLILPANPVDENDNIFTLVSIGAYSFWNSFFTTNKSISSVTIPETVTSIGAGAFSECKKLNNIEFSDNIISIGDMAFEGCSLTELSLPTSLVSIGEAAFSSCPITRVEIPRNTVSIGNYAFWSCDKLEEVIFSEQLRSIGNFAFAYDNELVEINIPESVTSIGEYTFRECEKLERVNLLGSISVIEKGVFLACTSLTSVKISDTVKKISEEAFKGCKSLEAVEMPNSVETIGQEAFLNCSNLNSLKFSNSLTEIGQQAFENCRALKSVKIPNSVEIIPFVVFAGCISLESVEIPNSVKTIQGYAFENCSSLKSVEIPSSVETIEEDAFSGCNALENIEYYVTQPVIAKENIFPDEVYNNATLTVALGGLDAAKATLPWSNFANIEGVQYVDEIQIEEAPELSLCIETEKALSMTVLPAAPDGYSYSLNWDSSNSSVVTVDENGKLKAVNPGTATITVASQDKMGVKKEILVTVVEHAHGDSNMSGEVTIADAVHTANYSVGNEVENLCRRAADVNGDNAITIADASGIVKIVLNQTSVASIAKVRGIVEEENLEGDKLIVDNYSGQIGETIGVGVSLDNLIDYIALQADVYIPEGMNLESVVPGNHTSDFTLMSRQIGERTYRVVLYNFDNRVFDNTEEPIFTLNLSIDKKTAEDIIVTHIIASDPRGNEYTLKSTGGHKGDIASIKVSENNNVSVNTENGNILVSGAEGSEVMVCTVEGKIISHFIAQTDTEVCNVGHGIYMVKVGSYVTKIIVR